MTPHHIPITEHVPHLDFEALRKRFPKNGQPLPARTARDLGKKIPHMKIGRNNFWPFKNVEEFERKHTVKP